MLARPRRHFKGSSHNCRRQPTRTSIKAGFGAHSRSANPEAELYAARSPEWMTPKDQGVVASHQQAQCQGSTSPAGAPFECASMCVNSSRSADSAFCVLDQATCHALFGVGYLGVIWRNLFTTRVALEQKRHQRVQRCLSYMPDTNKALHIYTPYLCLYLYPYL